MGGKELCIINSEYGELLGISDFINTAFEKFDRRQRPTDQGIGSQRQDEQYYEPVEKVIREFQTRHDINIYKEFACPQVPSSIYRGFLKKTGVSI